LRWGILGALLLVAAHRAAAGEEAAPGLARGGRVGWARLITESSSWSVHDRNDPVLATFIRSQTSLNIDPVCYPVDPHNLEALCAYPFIFTNNLANVRNATSLKNVREYLHRGGFIYADRCVNLSFSIPQEEFYDRHVAFFNRLLPTAEIRELPADHEIYRCYFNVDRRKVHAINSYLGHNQLYGVFDGGRMVALFSNENLQCGWPQGDPLGQMQLIANIYVDSVRGFRAWPLPRAGGNIGTGDRAHLRFVGLVILTQQAGRSRSPMPISR